jgi:hypothetical protein
MKMLVGKNGRKAISGILGAIFLFAILFTTGATYLTFVTLNMQNMNAELLNRNSVENNRLLERFTSVSYLDTGTGHIGVYLNNNASIAIKIVAILVIEPSTSTIVKLEGSPSLPIFINPSSWPRGPSLDTGITPVAGKLYNIRVLSERGNIAETTYPETKSPAVVAMSILTQGVGDVQMSFQSFMWATQSAPTTWNAAAQIPHSTNNVIWKVDLINHSPKDIYLSQHSALSIIRPGGADRQAWYIIREFLSSGAINPLTSSETILIPKNPSGDIATGGTSVTIYFSATVIGGPTPADFPSQIDIYYIFLGLQGTYTNPTSSDLYSQLIPFKTIYAP